MDCDNSKKVYTVYILKSKKDDKFYTGYSGNLELRLEEHQDGKVKSTQSRRPLELVFKKEFADRSEAVRYERYLKSPEGDSQKKELVRNYKSSSLKI